MHLRPVPLRVVSRAEQQAGEQVVLGLLGQHRVSQQDGIGFYRRAQVGNEARHAQERRVGQVHPQVKHQRLVQGRLQQCRQA